MTAVAAGVSELFLIIRNTEIKVSLSLSGFVKAFPAVLFCKKIQVKSGLIYIPV